jgi:hypothetical protein
MSQLVLGFAVAEPTLPSFVPLPPEMASYLDQLVTNYRTRLHLVAGIDELTSQLALVWPELPGGEDQALLLWQHITEALYPLAALSPQDTMILSIQISNQPLDLPPLPDSPALYLTYDSRHMRLRRIKLNPTEPPPDDVMHLEAGVAVLGQPMANFLTRHGDAVVQNMTDADLDQLRQRLLDQDDTKWPDLTLDQELLLFITWMLALQHFLQQQIKLYLHGKQGAILPWVFVISPLLVKLLQGKLLREATNPAIAPMARMLLRRAALRLSMPRLPEPIVTAQLQVAASTPRRTPRLRRAVPAKPLRLRRTEQDPLLPDGVPVPATKFIKRRKSAKQHTGLRTRKVTSIRQSPPRIVTQVVPTARLQQGFGHTYYGAVSWSSFEPNEEISTDTNRQTRPNFRWLPTIPLPPLTVSSAAAEAQTVPPDLLPTCWAMVRAETAAHDGPAIAHNYPSRRLRRRHSAMAHRFMTDHWPEPVSPQPWLPTPMARKPKPTRPAQPAPTRRDPQPEAPAPSASTRS